jgi:hypothetical protein
VSDLATHSIKEPVYDPDPKTMPRGRDPCFRNPRAALPKDVIAAGYNYQCDPRDKESPPERDSTSHQVPPCSALGYLIRGSEMRQITR